MMMNFLPTTSRAQQLGEQTGLRGQPAGNQGAEPVRRHPVRIFELNSA